MIEIPEIEIKTFRSISKPGKAVPGLDDDELAFLLLYFIFSILFMIFGLGMIPNLFGYKIPHSYMTPILQILYLWVPGLTLLFLKIFKIGKQDGYVFQKMYLFINSSLPEKIDMRNNPEQKLVIKVTTKILNFLKNKEIYKNSVLYKDYDLNWDALKEKEKIDRLNEEMEKTGLNLQRIRNQKNNEWILNVKRPVENERKRLLKLLNKEDK